MGIRAMANMSLALVTAVFPAMRASLGFMTDLSQDYCGVQRRIRKTEDVVGEVSGQHAAT